MHTLKVAVPFLLDTYWEFFCYNYVGILSS